ncbi:MULTISPECIES: methionine synthase [Clostridium]|uniref:Vitamin B12 dependent-methionine synthase activation domain-containing protein n=1 Tax=Clostridium nitritogenes TaxID=83340 RepID=A0ABP3X0T5_9CLOT|nr:methionine synthase [Clostridium baratii]MBT9831258.1 methionine synthase [Clostridium baratii]STB00360.1 vitamin B12-dependent methionine synthase MetH [Clostridium baratii]
MEKISIEINIDENEVLRYLGYKGQKIEEELLLKIRDTIEEGKKLFAPKVIYKEYPINILENGVDVVGTTLVLEGNDIKKLLIGSNRCILMAATIGNYIEKKIRLYERIDLTRGMILDSVSTTAVEELCDKVCALIEKDIIEDFEDLTFRYSPGYGDLSLNIQKNFIEVLDATRKIGVNASEHMLLFPRKSVTAIVGIRKKLGKKTKKSCINCKNYENCLYRKEENSCGFKGVY